ncbi:thioesterase II family protein [Amycolatopsis sp. 195334CR]|uniref:thioesterase II family protein n=1 Tax=Amycolatopsis sp. 195334CR TaxID=2814588 RepID=UPI001A8F5935|nr:alpha/beta fold hydrolase [Amycolatopsis sp. 195334CR]MBN6040836.1 thioesterase [Amycolatopsis sp. 195334CR]
MAPGAEGPWFPQVDRRQRPAVRLVCLGAAGTGASQFGAWSEALPESIEVWPVLLPGRERRIREEPLRRIDLIADELLAELVRLVEPGGPPWAFLGHSFGALVAYETARRLLDSTDLAVEGLVACSMPAPHVQADRLPVATDDDAALLDWVRTSGGVDDVLLGDARFARWLAADLRATLDCRRSYRLDRPVKLDCPVLVASGADDPEVVPDDLDEWRYCTTATFERITVGRGHYFLRSHQDALLELVHDRLTRWRSARSSSS